MAQHEFRSSTELTVEEANREHIESARAFANAPQIGPAPVDADPGPHKSPPVGKRVDMGPVSSSTPYHVTPSLDPKSIEAIDGYEDFQVELRVAHNALSSAQVGLEQIANARALADRIGAWTDAQKLLNVGDAAGKKMESILALFQKADEQLTKLANSLERELTQPLASSALGGFNIEIRARLSQMTKDQREEMVANSVRSSDETIVNAVLGAPALLSGVDPLRHQMWTRQWHEARSPDAVRKLAAVRKAIDIVQDRAPLMFKQTELAMRGSFSKLKAVREADSAATQALLMQTADDPTV